MAWSMDDNCIAFLGVLEKFDLIDWIGFAGFNRKK
jgi:hypothetical protein